MVPQSLESWAAAVAVRASASTGSAPVATSAEDKPQWQPLPNRDKSRTDDLRR
jgi:hypothetical protein